MGRWGGREVGWCAICLESLRNVTPKKENICEELFQATLNPLQNIARMSAFFDGSCVPGDCPKAGSGWVIAAQEPVSPAWVVDAYGCCQCNAISSLRSKIDGFQQFARAIISLLIFNIMVFQVDGRVANLNHSTW